ncbi:putative phenylalanine ammonia-lyase [Colletotrichum tofieldiae]|nr:putative phenylalanine ammonia-lyase [Colletotrichum tofieldiae]
MAAHRQITQEFNFSADNPLVDTEAREIYYGANFQAAAVTSAMEKVRLALQISQTTHFSPTPPFRPPFYTKTTLLYY